jgi:4-hydroxyphenylpyruvate dioxygenase
MSDLLHQPGLTREPLQPSYSDEANPIGLDGIEFIEYATAQPQALGQVLEMMGFYPIARHRSREVTLYRQGALNIVVNAHPADVAGSTHGMQRPSLSAIALRVRDARAARAYVLARGAWEVPTHPEAMELHIPALHGVGGSRIYLVDRYQDFSIYDVDFLPIPNVRSDSPPVLPGLHFFGVVQYIGTNRAYDWIEFYGTLLGARLIPDEQRFGIMPAGKLMALPAREAKHGFMLQLIEPSVDDESDKRESLQRIGLGVPDVLDAVQRLRARGVEFVEGPAAHTEQRGALTKAYLGGVVFELVHSELGAAP